MTLMGGGTMGGGGFDWGGFATQAANIIGGIYSTKAQTKLLRQMNRMGSRQFLAAATGRLPVGPLNYAMPFSGVPAASGSAGGGQLGSVLATLGLGGLLPSPGGIADVLPGGLEEIGAGTGLFGLDMFEPTKSGQRARPLLMANNPSSGRVNFWRSVGAPMLFRGDLRVAKLVNKVAQRASRGRTRAGCFPRRKRRAC